MPAAAAVVRPAAAATPAGPIEPSVKAKLTAEPIKPSITAPIITAPVSMLLTNAPILILISFMAFAESVIPDFIESAVASAPPRTFDISVASLGSSLE